jgi:hypothetical protein
VWGVCGVWWVWWVLGVWVCGVCGDVGCVGVWGVWVVRGVWGVWGCNEQSRPLLTFDIPQTALVATLDTYDFLCIATNICQLI